jgi:hypothetical protein
VLEKNQAIVSSKRNFFFVFCQLFRRIVFWGCKITLQAPKGKILSSFFCHQKERFWGHQKGPPWSSQKRPRKRSLFELSKSSSKGAVLSSPKAHQKLTKSSPKAHQKLTKSSPQISTSAFFLIKKVSTISHPISHPISHHIRGKTFERGDFWVRNCAHCFN